MNQNKIIDSQTISWIFLATAMASETEPTDFKGISSLADGINHAVPTHKKLQTSISWLTTHGLIIKKGRKYELTIKGKLEYKTVSGRNRTLMQIWEKLEQNFKRSV